MKIVFFSNYLTHHQIPFCLEMLKQEDVEFYFVSTEEMDEERKRGGWSFSKEYPFEVKAYLSNCEKEKALRLAVESDVMIIGSAPEEYVAYRMKNAKEKLTFRYSERIYKGGRWRVLSPRGFINRIRTYFRYWGKPLYMLCASAYTAGDLAMLGSYIGKCFKWGYFPKTKHCEIDKLLEGKEEGSILWVARMIDLKHPEIPIYVAKKLKDAGYQFKLTMIGVGPLLEPMQKLISDNELSDYVNLLGAMSPEEVRVHMDKSKILLFTSDQHEGWGAVLNEAMNSGCVVVANSEIGSVPFLVKNGENGYIYRGNKAENIYDIVKDLIEETNKTAIVGKNAYCTIVNTWSESVAAERLVSTCKSLLKGCKSFFDEGPCSKAKIKVKKG